MIFMLPLAASAIAAAAPAAMASAASATLGATIMATAKSLAMNLAVSTAMSALQPKVGGAGRMSDWMLDENAPIPFPMGRVGVSGAAVYQKTFGPDLMYKGVVSVLGGAGPIDGYESFKADEELVTFDGNGKAITSQYANELWLKRTLGTQPDTALTLPPGLKNGGTAFGWTAAHKLSGKPAALHIMGENSKYTAFPTGEIKGIHVLRGLKGWDPRQDSTYPGGLGPCRLNNPATWVYLRRPGLWGLKWALGLWEGPTLKGAPAHGSETDFQVGGIGAMLSGVDVPAFVALENICDANDWTLSGYPSTDDDKHEVLKSILQAGGAVYAQRAGKISCVIRSAPRASVVTVTAADTAGEMQLDTGASRIDRLNTIRPQIVSESHGWQLTAIPKVSALAYRTEDGGTRSRGIDYSYVDKATQGAQLAALEIANTREAFAGIVPLKPHLQKIKPGDAFTIDDPEFVLDGQKCLCLNTEYSAETGAVTVTFVSETDAKYPFALGQTSTPPEPAVLTPEDHVVTPPAPGEWALAAVNFTDGGVSVPVLLFTGDVQNARTESVIFEYRPVGAADWSFAGSEDQTVTRKEAAGGALTAGTAYEGAVSYRVGGRISTRLLLGPVNAGAITAGDVAPITPANVAGIPSLAITTTIAPDGTQTSRLWGDFADAADALSYVAEIDDGTVVQQVPLAESAIEDRIVATGPSYRYRVKAVSRTGTVSAAWSAWSNLSTAGGDNTPPAPITAPYIQGGIGQIAMRWANPTDDDLQRVLIFRNVSALSPADTGEAPYAWATGTSFIDQAAEIGTVYYYWGLTQDRTGNGTWANLVYIGTASARRTRFDTDLTLIPPRLDPHPIYGGDYMMTERLIYDDGTGVQALKPLEGGANKTETRTAAAFQGQGLLATKNVAAWGSDVGGRPAELVDGRIGAGLTAAGRAKAMDIPDVRATNEDPAQYRARGQGVWQEFKERAAIGAPGNVSYVQLETVVPWAHESGGAVVQTVRSAEGSYQRRSVTFNDAAGWTAWVKSYDQLNRPAFGSDLLESGGAVATDGSYKTILGVADSVLGQGALALRDSLALGDGTLSGFGGLAAKTYIRLGAPSSDGWATLIDENNAFYVSNARAITELGVSASFAGQGLLATKNQANFGTDISAIPGRLSAHPSYGAAYLPTSAIVYEGGGGLEYYRPLEPLANVTETRTASAISGQGYFATQNYADWASRVTGTGKPADNAGTSGILTPIGNYTLVRGNKVWKQPPGYHGAFEGGAVGAAQKGSCFISSSLLSVEAGGGWITTLALDDDATSFLQTDTSYSAQWNPGAGVGEVYLFGPNASAPVTVSGIPATKASRMTLAYDGASVFVEVDGSPARLETGPARPAAMAEVLDYYVSINSTAPSGVEDVQHGAWTEKTTTAVNARPVNTNTEVHGTSMTKVAGGDSWNTGSVSREGYRGAAVCAARPGVGRPDNLVMFGLSDAGAAYDGSYVGINYAWYASYSPADAGLIIYESGGYGNTVVAAGAWSVEDVLSVTYDGTNVYYLRNGVVIRTVYNVGSDRVFHFATSHYREQGGVRDVQFGAGPEAPRIDRIRNTAGTAQYGQSQLVTVEGPAASVIGQTGWATNTRGLAAISKLDDTGRITDGQALPLNGMGRSASIAPAYPISAGSDPATQFNIAAVTATFAGGSTLSFGSATLTGLTASTYYTVFRDLLTNSYVALSSGTAPYFTSAQRYLYIGIQSTQDVGGGYEPPPPPPPGSGGGFRDIPDYYLEP